MTKPGFEPVIIQASTVTIQLQKWTGRDCCSSSVIQRFFYVTVLLCENWRTGLSGSGSGKWAGKWTKSVVQKVYKSSIFFHPLVHDQQLAIMYYLYININCTGVLASLLMRGMATLPQGTQELLVVRDKVGRPPGELGVASPWNVISFSSVLWHCWLGDRKGIRAVKETGCWFVGGGDLTGALHDL